jgi:hypothetical protein
VKAAPQPDPGREGRRDAGGQVVRAIVVDPAEAIEVPALPSPQAGEGR